MKSLRLFLALSFVSIAFAGLVRADDKDKAAAKPDVCCCCGQSLDKAKMTDKKKCDPSKCCCGKKGGWIEKEMPKPSYNRKS